MQLHIDFPEASSVLLSCSGFIKETLRLLHAVGLDY